MIPCPTCCNQTCVIGVDLFDTDLSQFTTTGSPSVSGGSLLLGTSDGVLFTAAAGSVNDATRVYATIDTSDDPAELKLLIAATDFDDNLWGSVSVNATTWTIRVGRYVGGVASDYTDAVEIDAPTLPAVACLSWEPGEVQTGASFVTAANPTASDSTGWDSLSNIFDEDDTPAEYQFLDIESKELEGHAFPLAVPPGSSIDGIIATVRSRWAPLSGIAEIEITNVRLNIAGLAVGDDKGDNATIAHVTYGDISYGGAADDWNAGLTWEDIGPDLGVVFTFESQGNQGIQVDAIWLEIHFTTPDRQPGQLRLAIDGKCVTEYSAENASGGLKAGVLSEANDWELPDLNYEYLQSASRPTCGVCACDVPEAEPCECCDPDFPPAASYTVDLGAGGWTDSTCTFCDEVEGVYVLDAVGSCQWFHQESVSGCPTDDASNCYPDFLLFSLRLENDGSDCRWVLTISWTGVCDPGAEQNGVFARYESDPLDSLEDCQEPATLNKTHDASGVCGGALPATVDLDVA